MRTARTVLDTEVKHIESHLCQRSSSTGTGKTGTDDDDVQTTFVSRVNEFLMVLVVRPFKLERSCRNLCVRRSDDFGLFLGSWFSLSLGCLSLGSYQLFRRSHSRFAGFLGSLSHSLHSLFDLFALRYLLYFLFNHFGCFLSSIQYIFFLCHNLQIFECSNLQIKA